MYGMPMSKIKVLKVKNPVRVKLMPHKYLHIAIKY